jgi:outer membrane lipoprotein carrier protein
MITTIGCALMLTLAAAGKPEAPAAGKPKAKTPPKDEITALVDSVQHYYEKTKDYTADFIQIYRRVALSQDTESRGTLQLKRPGLVRWAYAKPTEKLFLVDGKRLWMADPEYEQVMVDANFKTSELSATIKFLWGEGKLTDNFTAKLIDGKPLGATKEKALELTPKTGATYAKVVLLVDPSSGEVKESVLYESAGNTNRFKFTNVKLNTGLKEDLFTYTPPPGWEVIHR